MMGIFGDESDEEGGGGGGGLGSKKGGGGGDKRPLAAKPVSFVSSAKPAAVVPEGPAKPKPPPPPAKVSFAKAAAAAPAEKVDKEFGSFEKNSSGFGSKMLAKMGWVQGNAIGKNAQGVVNPIEARLRPNSMGLGFGGYHETTSKAKQQQKRILHADGGAALEEDDSDDDDAEKRRKAKLRAEHQRAERGDEEPKVNLSRRHRGRTDCLLIA